jgi:hypothetical protein
MARLAPDAPIRGRSAGGDEIVGIIEILASLFRGKPGKNGMWDFLGKRSADKSRVELEKARNEGTQKLIPLLKPGMVLIEDGPDWFAEKASLSRQIGSDGIGGIAVQTVAGVIVAAGSAGISMSGVVLHIAQGRAGVQGEGNR